MRGKGEGSIRQRADGRWEMRLDLGRGLDGKRRRKSVFAATQADAVQQLRRLSGRAADHRLTASTPTVAVYLKDWFGAHADRWRPSTRRGYQGAIDRFLVPAFGPCRLERLTPLVVQRWLTQHKAAHGARRRITLAHAVLRSALSEARRLQLVSINAAELVTVPKPRPRPIRPANVEQATALLTAVGEHRLYALFAVALACGLRLGEACGLRWEDVDLDTGAIRVRQQLQKIGARLELHPLKTPKSRRTLMLPEVCRQALRGHRTRQLAERLRAGEYWVETGLVFTTYQPRHGGTAGAGLDPRNVLRTFHRLLATADPPMPRMRFHDLRHSAASLLIAAGVELVEVSLLLGHSELRVTADLYAHLQTQTAARAARHMDAVLSSPRRGGRKS